jgi:murein L,D-transpeptidase YafK
LNNTKSTKLRSVVLPKIEVIDVEQSLENSLNYIGAKVGDAVFIRVFKKEKILELWVEVNGKYKLCKTYTICAYSGKLGPKLKQGDKQSPEGFYIIKKNQLKPNSKYHLAFNLGFPNQYDKNLGRTGSYLMIHGKCSSSGCYAMGDRQIEEIYKMVNAALKTDKDTIAVHIFPFKMTQDNMYKHATNRWYKFWVNLKLGYDIFDRYGVVPIVKSPETTYRFYIHKDKKL